MAAALAGWEDSKAQQAVPGSRQAATLAHLPAAPRTVLAVQYMDAAASSLGRGASPAEYRRAKGVPSSTCTAQPCKAGKEEQTPHSSYSELPMGMPPLAVN